MPELPEVETIRLGLQQMLVGKVVAGVVVESPKSFPNSAAEVNHFLIGTTITELDRRGKGLIIMLDSGYSLLTHLKMTGQLVYRSKQGQGFGGGHPTDSLVGSLPDKSTRVSISFEDGSQLFFNDQRKFGWMKLLPTDELQSEPFIAKLGPEALADDFDFKMFKANLMRRIFF